MQWLSSLDPKPTPNLLDDCSGVKLHIDNLVGGFGMGILIGEKLVSFHKSDYKCSPMYLTTTPNCFVTTTLDHCRPTRTTFDMSSACLKRNSIESAPSNFPFLPIVRIELFSIFGIPVWKQFSDVSPIPIVDLIFLFEMTISHARRTWEPNSAPTTQHTFPLKICLFTIRNTLKNCHVHFKEFYLSSHQQIRRGQPPNI